MNNDMHYDPITLNQWLWYRLQCHEASGTEFQSLFEKIIKKSKPEFVSIRPYGNIGDRKCDGLFEAGETIFQVYSPDELTQREVENKIEEDLAGAVLHWNDKIKKWVFVYNARRGLPPDVPKILSTQQEKYPNIKIDYLNSEMLWEMVRSLSVQQRAEILGAPNGYEILFLAPQNTSKDIQNTIGNARFTIIHDVMSPVSIESVLSAIEPKKIFWAPFYIRPTIGKLPWNSEAIYQKTLIDSLLQKTWDLSPRFSIFSLAPIPLVLQLGFLLSNRAEIECYQFNRDNRSWRWTDEEYDNTFNISGFPKDETNSEEVIIRVSLSAKISRRDTVEAIGEREVEIDIMVNNPDVMWLKNPTQLINLSKNFRDVLSTIRNKMPNVKKIHLFYAGPTGGAIVIGQQINPRMDAQIETYQYSRQQSPKYQFALTLHERNNYE